MARQIRNFRICLLLYLGKGTWIWKIESDECENEKGSVLGR